MVAHKYVHVYLLGLRFYIEKPFPNTLKVNFGNVQSILKGLGGFGNFRITDSSQNSRGCICENFKPSLKLKITGPQSNYRNFAK